MENKDFRILTDTELEETVGGTRFEKEEDAIRFAKEFPVGTRVSLGELFYPGKEVTGVVVVNQVMRSLRLDGSTEFYFNDLEVMVDESCRLRRDLTTICIMNGNILTKLSKL